MLPALPEPAGWLPVQGVPLANARHATQSGDARRHGPPTER
jgi:hypothetical protein